jgi:hypothetical protein
MASESSDPVVILTHADKGSWLITTSMASRYLIVLDAPWTLTRFRGDGCSVSELRLDGDAMPLSQLAAAVGQPMVAVIDVRADGISTVRRTSLVVSIERVVVPDVRGEDLESEVPSGSTPVRAVDSSGPGHGPEAGGGEAARATFNLMVARARLGRIDRGMVLYGPRGAGQSKLLGQLRQSAEQAGWLTVELVVPRGASVLEDLVRELRAAANRIIGPAVPGRADTGDAELDLWVLVEDLSAALKSGGLALALFIDDMHTLEPAALSVLLAVQHKAGQHALPAYLFGAGSPRLPRVLGDAQPYAERLFDYRPFTR